MGAEQSFQYQRRFSNVATNQSSGHGSMLYSMPALVQKQDELLLNGALHVHVVVMSQGFPEVCFGHLYFSRFHNVLGQAYHPGATFPHAEVGYIFACNSRNLEMTVHGNS